MSVKLIAAVEALTEELETQARAVAETKKMINALRRRMGEEPLFPDETPESVHGGAGIKAGSYYGKPLATAMIDVLRRRGSAASTEEVLADLRRGEFDFKALGWQEAGLVRSVAMSMAKNTKAFHRLPSGSFGLLEWYPALQQKSAVVESKRPAAKAKRKGSAASKPKKQATPAKRPEPQAAFAAIGSKEVAS